MSPYLSNLSGTSNAQSEVAYDALIYPHFDRNCAISELWRALNRKKRLGMSCGTVFTKGEVLYDRLKLSRPLGNFNFSGAEHTKTGIFGFFREKTKSTQL